MDPTRLQHAEKIRKIIARASSPFEGEARLAATRAWELISRYSLQYPTDIIPQPSASRWTPREQFAGSFKAAERIWRSLGYSFREYVPDSDRPAGNTTQDTRNQSYRSSTRTADFYTTRSGVTYGHKNRWTTEEYRGKNQEILEDAQKTNGWASREWAGFGQIRDHGGSVKGQHGTQIEKWFKTTDRNGKERLACKRLYVFNMDQVSFGGAV
jgi:hypothetical protein